MRIAEQITKDTVYQGVTASNLALLYQHHGDFILAEKYYLAALSFYRGSSDRRLDRRTGTNLASLYLEIGQPSKAERLLRSLISDAPQPSVVDQDDAVLLSDLASIRVQQNRLADAERLFRAVIGFLEDRHDEENQEIRANVMSDLAYVLSLSGRSAEAAAYSRRAVQVFESLPQAYAGNLVKALANLAMITAAAGESSESAELFRRAIAASESELGPEHPLLGQVLARYAVLLRKMHRNADARKVEGRARQIQTRSRDENLLGYTVCG